MTSAKCKNVLFIAIDDLRPQLGCYGHPQIISPNIDSLAADGLVFKRAYCQQAICGPSRASVLSGCRPDTTGIYTLTQPLRETVPDILSLPQHFRNNGYETISVGKIYHHEKDDLEGWCNDPFRSEGDWLGRGYLTDEALEQMKQNTELLAARGDTRHGLGPAYECADVDDCDYHDGKDASAAIAEMERLATGDKPFFLAVGFHKPHLPFNAPKKYWDLYDHDSINLAANPFEPENITPYSLVDFGEMRGYFGIPKEGPVDEQLARTLIHGYCACVSYVDAQIGRVIKRLDELNLRDSTAIMLWGDHGWKLGEHASWCKHSNFEIDTRAPLIVSTPDTLGKNMTTDSLVEFVDMYPTLCELCGLQLPGHLEGTSLCPLIENPAASVKEVAISQYPRKDVMGYSLRSDRYRYTEWRDHTSGKLLATELYDHHSDNQENINAADLPQYADAVAQLARQMASFNFKPK